MNETVLYSTQGSWAIQQLRHNAMLEWYRNEKSLQLTFIGKFLELGCQKIPRGKREHVDMHTAETCRGNALTFP